MQIQPEHDELATLKQSINESHSAALELATQGLELMRQALDRAIVAGEKLCRVKEIVPHGQYEKWIEDNCTFSTVTATKYVRLAKANHGKLLENANSIREAYIICGIVKEHTPDPVAASDSLLDQFKNASAKEQHGVIEAVLNPGVHFWDGLIELCTTMGKSWPPEEFRTEAFRQKVRSLKLKDQLNFTKWVMTHCLGFELDPVTWKITGHRDEPEITVLEPEPEPPKLIGNG